MNRVAVLFKMPGKIKRSHFMQLPLFGSLIRMAVKRRAKTAPRHPHRATNQQNEDLTNIWRSLIAQYFPERGDLYSYRIAWSRRRQRRILGSCNIKSRRVNIAREMQAPECASLLPALVYHELCHAVLGQSLERRSRSFPWHGKEFKALEARHPGSAVLTEWIKTGGWTKAVRRARSREMWRHRRGK